MKGTDESTLDATRDRVLTENTAQSVRNYLRNLASSRDVMLPRWIWELLQNARDASLDSGQPLVADVERTASEVIFRHNGRRFTDDEVAHLIYHGSTKAEDQNTIGQYGSGFLTTHLLSPDIDVSGQCSDGRYFEFRISRKVGSVQELSDSMNHVWECYKQSLAPSSGVQTHTTEFRYGILPDAADAVDNGLAMLERCAPLIMVFNPEFDRIELRMDGRILCFIRKSETVVPAMGLSEIVVEKRANENRHDLRYAVARNETTSVAVPVTLAGGGRRGINPIAHIPRLFLGFPLVGTEDFSFPAIVNDFDFAPNDGRSGVYLGLSDNSDNHRNQSAIERACELLAGLLEHAANQGWENTHLLANVPAVREREWLNRAWLRDTLGSQFVDVIRRTPAVITGEGDAKSPREANLPYARTADGVVALWDLLNEWRGGIGVLPKRSEVVGWWNVVESWANVRNTEGKLPDEAIDGRKLAQRIEESTRHNGDFGTLEDLQTFLTNDVKVTEWLNRLYIFLFEDEHSQVVRDSYIIPDQDGLLDKLPNLFRDRLISAELKDVANLLDRNVRRELRDVYLASLVDETGKGDLTSDQLVQELLPRLRQRAESNPDEDFKKASVRLFVWILGREDWGSLEGFPVFSEEASAGHPRIIQLTHSGDGDVRPLAPVSAWDENLQPYAELFPARYTLAQDFYEAVPDRDVWRLLDEREFLRNHLLVTKSRTCDEFLPGDNLIDDVHHASSEYVNVTSVAFLVREDVGIMDRVRQSQPLASLFWRFLTEWLVHHDSDGLMPHEAACGCGENHFYLPGEWLGPVKNRQWVPLGARRSSRATAESLAILLRDGGSEIGRVIENPQVVQLLDAAGVARVDLMRGLVAATDEDRSAMDRELIHLMTATGGNVDPIRDFAQDLENDPDLLGHLADRRKQRQLGRQNQDLGRCVEQLVKESLECEGFYVKREPIGSDFAIEYDSVEDGQEMGIEVEREGRRWLVEVKATRNENDGVRMTAKQAYKAACKADAFLLCVVPVEQGDSLPEFDAVKSSMRFVQNIAPYVRPLCENLDRLNTLRDGIRNVVSSGFQLVVDDGTARVSVARSVWEDEGFPLEHLRDRLAQ